MKYYSKAPYNFIPLSNRILTRYKSIDELPSHNEFVEGTYIGTIEYTIKCESDIIISDGNNNFFKDADGRYAIPGSSIRGTIRNNAITLGMSSVKDDISNDRFLYRRFAAKTEKNGILSGKRLNEEYIARVGMESRKKYTILKNVKAGYIKCIGDEDFEIVPAKEELGKTYFQIREKDLRDKQDNVKEVKYMYKNYADNEEDYYNSNNINKNLYYPYSVDIYYDIDINSRMIKKISKEELKYSGVLINSNFIGGGYEYNDGKKIYKGKKVHYIINEKSNKECIKVNKEDIRTYKRYYRKDKKDTNTIKGINELKKAKESEYFSLPEKDEEKPVFYINYNGRTYFGFTPYLRLFYDKNVHDGLPVIYKEKENLEKNIDYNKALFGFTSNDLSYKSRISFQDAISEGSVKSEKVCLGLAGPKPTCIAHYLKQNKDEYSTYNGDFDIRGIKFYWMKDSIAKVIENGKGEKRDNVNSNEEAIKKGAIFKGKITFNNLYEDELGLLIYSLCLKDGCYQQIGMAKPYGYGRVSINDVKIVTEDIGKRYSSLFEKSVNLLNKDELIEGYKKYVINNFDVNGIKDIDEDFAIKTLFNVKSIVRDNYDQYDYLELGEFKDFNPLPTVDGVMEKSELYKKGQSNEIKNKNSNNNRINNTNTRKKASNKGNEVKRVNKRNDFENSPFAALKDFKFDK